MTRFGNCFATLVVLLTFGLTATAQAAWEAPQRIDTAGEDRGDTTDGDVAAGANGLATIFFLQATDEATLSLFTRRNADAAAWSDPLNATYQGGSGDPEPPKPTSNPQPELEANNAGDAGLALRARRDIAEPEPDNPQANATRDAIFGGGWPAASVPSSLRQLLGEDAETATPTGRPDVDVDKNAVGHVVAAYSDNDLRYGQFSVASGQRNAEKERSGFVQHPPEFPDPTDPPDGFTPPNDQDPIEPATAPQIDVNENGDVAISYVAVRNPADQKAPNTTAVYVRRKKAAQDDFSRIQQVSHEGEDDSVTQHDVAIAPDGTIVVLFAASPGEGNNNIYARRWLPGADAIRPESTIELVSSSDPENPAASRPRVVTDDSGRLTAAWLEGGARLLSAERTTNWTLPEALSAAAGEFDVAVDTDGTGTIVYHEGAKLQGRMRATGTKWGAAETISTTSVDTDVAPRVDAQRPKQADVFFVQQNGSLESGYAARGTGDPPVTPPQPPKPGSGDCPGDINVINGDDGNNNLTGTDGRDSILGGGGNDALFGAGDNDCLRGEAGDDTVDGDAGDDNLGGGDGADRLTGGDGNDSHDGGAGVDSINGNDGNDTASGGDDNDAIDGSAGNDILAGDAGEDRIRGGSGDDLLGGGDDDDTIFGGRGDNVILAGAGDDMITGGRDRDVISGEDGNDRVQGRKGGGKISGNAGDDVLNGGTGRERINGGTGRDIMTGRPGQDVLKGGKHNDTMYGGTDRDRVFGNRGNDRVFGNTGEDRVLGGGGRDSLRGGSSTDVLKGGKGRDFLNGEAGEDFLFGGKGNDRIKANDRRADTIECGKGNDTVLADRADKVAKDCETVKRVGPRIRPARSG